MPRYQGEVPGSWTGVGQEWDRSGRTVDYDAALGRIREGIVRLHHYICRPLLVVVQWKDGYRNPTQLFDTACLLTYQVVEVTSLDQTKEFFSILIAPHVHLYGVICILSRAAVHTIAVVH